MVSVQAVKREAIMAPAYMAAMRMARQLAAAQMIPQQDAAERAFNKLARTFAAQMDTLKRYRSKGEQKVTVQHVTVNDGGQAVVGDVRTGGRGDGKA
jgi:Tfp pilus assembly protein PilE